MQKQAEANRQKMDSDQVHVPSMRPNIDMKHDDKWAMPRNENTTKPEQSQQKPLLTEKMRNTLIKRFNAVTEDKKQTYYTRTKANLESQLEKAKTNKNTRLARKITETLYILDSVLGSTDDSADDEIINSATAQ